MPSVSKVGHVNRGCRATLFETSVVVHQPAFAGAAHPLYGQSLRLRESYKWLRTSKNSGVAKFMGIAHLPHYPGPEGLPQERP